MRRRLRIGWVGKAGIKIKVSMTMNVFETLSRSARQWPDRTAIIDAGGSLDYRSLWREVEALRAQLDRLGVREGEGVGVRARNGRSFIIGALAALGCGAVIMPIHHQMKPAELSDMLARAPLCVILDDGSGAAQPGKTIALENPGGNGLRFTRLDGPQRPLARGIKDAAFVRFTSGTTGKSKGVVLTHRDVLERIQAANSGLGLTCEDKILWVLPMAYHFYVSIILYLEAGATVLVSADYLAESMLDAATKHQATFLYVTPMHIRMLTSESSGRTLSPSLQRIMSVSSRLEPQMARNFSARYHVPVSQGFGIIEVGLPIMNIAEAAEYPEAIGRPVSSFEAMIVDEMMKSLPEGETGQLALRGPGMFSGYLNPPRSREEVLCDGWFLTGDLAHRDSGGRIVLDGRTSSVIQVAGHKVFPEEIAGVLDQHPAVLRSRVFARPHPQMGEAVCAEVQLRNGSSQAASEDILAFCRRQLSSHKVPTALEFVAEISMTSSGKVRHGPQPTVSRV
ncbi:MAG TPA: class I adenylate-forming enzyme family protein [Candidatus Nitrosopolaris sp.]|nr:class I adenylate-forming enzyme family protein [Candidatus Nitrosopolaris sp.]